MKTVKRIIVGTVLLASLSGLAETYFEYMNGYEWAYRIIGEAVEIYRYFSVPAISPDPTGTVTIPSTLGGKNVTSIGDGAFIWCRGLTNVTIPNSVTNIGSGAFDGCTSMRDVTIPSSVSNIGRDAF